MSSCSSTEDVTARYPYISSLANTNCLSHIDTDSEFSRGSDATGIFEMTVNGTTAHCKFTSLDYPCDFEKVNISLRGVRGPGCEMTGEGCMSGQSISAIPCGTMRNIFSSTKDLPASNALCLSSTDRITTTLSSPFKQPE